ncbi:hypothetical protein LTR67_011094 [Exophiala xenobiotica]
MSEAKDDQRSQASAKIPTKLPDPNQNPKRFSEFDLQGKVFIVTGGGRGLGLSLAESLVEARGQVYCLDRLTEPDEEFNTVAAGLAASFQGALRYCHMDVRDTNQLESIVESIASEHSRLDGVIAAAGVQHISPALDYPPQEIMKMMDINFKGVFCTAAACARQMIRFRCKGSIVLVASMSGFIANKGLITSVYNSSKAAVIQLSKNLAMEWGKSISRDDGTVEGGIRVNALCPGHILTPMVEKNFEEVPGLKETWEKENMLGRLSSPTEYRGAALFLLSDASSFMTGASLVIDGGHSAW